MTRTRSLLALLALALGAVSAAGASARISATGDYKLPENAYVISDVPGYNSWPMIQAVGTKLFCSYSRDNARPPNGHTIHPGSRDSYLRLSLDGGRTWSDEITVAADPKIGEVNEGIGLDETGAAILWVRCWGKDRRHELYRTVDGKAIEKIATLRPDPFPMQIMDPVRVEGLGLVSPWFAGSYRQNGANSWGLFVSADNGRTWTQRIVEKELSIKEWVTEPSLVDLGGGRLLIVGRCEQRLGNQFQVTSVDGGKTWKKARTNIGDVRESTPSLVYDATSGLVANYYYHRGARQLKRRVVQADFIFDHPDRWPEPEVLAVGFEQRPHDAGNVKATRLGDMDCCAWYTGTQSNATVVVTVVSKPAASVRDVRAEDEPAYCVTTDHPDGLYRCGETATFTVTVDTNRLAKAVNRIEVQLDNFGPCVLTNAVFDLAATNAFSISGTLREPGFLRLVLPLTKDRRKAPSDFSVGFEPEKIKKGSPSPKDFDAFWEKAKANLDATVPLDPQLRLLPERSDGAFNFWRISFAGVGGTRVYGFLSVPKDASAEKKYPVRFQVPAAGGGRASWTNNMKGAPDAICMLMTVHPYEPPFNLDELNKCFSANTARLSEKYGVDNYAVAGIAVSREDYYFYRALLGINRAVDWLARRPDVDLTSFTYSGTSQGGGFGFYLLGMNHHFTKGALFVPAITDTMGYRAGRLSGWPRIVENQKEEGKAAAERNAPYSDGANFAARIACPVRVAVGFSDVTCPPCAVYAAYNEIPVKDKRIYHGIGMTHSCRKEFYHTLSKWQNER